jgi:hypothetical protein
VFVSAVQGGQLGLMVGLPPRFALFRRLVKALLVLLGDPPGVISVVPRRTELGVTRRLCPRGRKVANVDVPPVGWTKTATGCTVRTCPGGLVLREDALVSFGEPLAVNSAISVCSCRAVRCSRSTDSENSVAGTDCDSDWRVSIIMRDGKQVPARPSQ